MFNRWRKSRWFFVTQKGGGAQRSFDICLKTNVFFKGFLTLSHTQSITEFTGLSQSTRGPGTSYDQTFNLILLSECSATTPSPSKKPPVGPLEKDPFKGRASSSPPVGSLQTEAFKGLKISPPHEGNLLTKPPIGKKNDNKEKHYRATPPKGFELRQPPRGVNFSTPYKGNENHLAIVGILHTPPPRGKDLNHPWTGPCTPVPPTGPIVTLHTHIGKSM